MERAIKILHNSEIDLERWDEKVRNAVNSRIYAESWYLDCVAPDWMGMIYGDYEYLMPIVQNKKFSIKYLYQPRFAQQHGIFPPSTPEISNLFIKKLKINYRYFNLSLNAINVSVKELVEVENRRNHILSLKHDLKTIQEKYNDHAKRYIRKSNKLCSVSTLLTLDDFIELKTKFSHKGFSNKLLKKLKLIMHKSLQDNRGIIYGAYSKQNELIAAAFFLREKKRFTYLNSVSSPEGKLSRAMYAIVNQFIIDHANQDFLLDFEGSNIEGIARFFIGFGAETEYYQHIQYNNLPWFLKIFKK